jgi:DNA-binding transcriptional LysR family regulator
MVKESLERADARTALQRRGRTAATSSGGSGEAVAGLARIRRATWNWLPAFVEVADAGSVAAAATRLALTPAAVSRTLGLLEDALGEPVFNRVGRRLVLNPAGAALRGAVRAAIRDVEGGLDEMTGDALGGPLRVASIGVLTEHFVVPALIEIKRAHPALVPEHENLRTVESNAKLQRGELDVAFYYEDVIAEGVVVERLGATPTGVYCGRGHPLFAKAKVARADILAHPFSVPMVGDTGRVMDGWPTELQRSIGMRITLLRSNLDVCRSGLMLTVLPDVTAAPGVHARELRRLAGVDLPPIEVFAAQAAGGRRDRAALVIEWVRARLLEPVGRPRRR